MLEVLQFIFSDIWTFLGTCVLIYGLSVLTYALSSVVNSIPGKDIPFTLSGLRRKAIKDVIYELIIKNNDVENINVELVNKKVDMINETISTAKKNNGIISNKL